MIPQSIFAEEACEKIFLSVVEFRLLPLDSVRLDGYIGFVLRGKFGNSLRAVVCPENSKECYKCSLQNKCAFPRIFLPRSRQVPAFAGRVHHPPPPYVIKVCSGSSGEVCRGNPLSIHVVLVGDAASYIAEVLAAFSRIWERGLCMDGGRFSLERVKITEVWGRDLKSRLKERNFEGCSHQGKVRLFFNSPLRIKEKGKLVRWTPHFSLIVENLCRRISLLSALYCGGKPAEEVFSESMRVTDVRTVCEEMEWVEWERYSTRQEMRMILGGMVGGVTYLGQVQKYLLMLKLGEFLNVGKATTFGFGGYVLHEMK